MSGPHAPRLFRAFPRGAYREHGETIRQWENSMYQHIKGPSRNIKHYVCTLRAGESRTVLGTLTEQA